MIKKLIFALLVVALWPIVAMAVVPSVSSYKVTLPYDPFPFGEGSTEAAACSNLQGAVNAVWGPGHVTSLAGSNVCNLTGTGLFPIVTVQTCPANSSGTTSCTCNSGFTETGTGASATCSSAAELAKVIADGLNLVGAPLVGSGGPTLNACYAGFVMRGTGAASNGSTINEIYPPFTATGATCSTTPATPNTSGLNCPSTSYTGTVNGVSTCVPGVSNMASGPSVAASAPSGSASAPVSAIPNAPPTATGSTASTTCTSGTCTTTTQFTDGGGSAVGSSTTATPQADFCKSNPGAAVCAADDPCVKNPDLLSCQKLGTVDSSGVLTKTNQSVNLSPISFTSSATCPANIPMNFSIMGHAFTPSMSYSGLCAAANDYVKPVLLLLALAGSAFIFVGGLKS
jgi:hypothetical protein